MSEYKQQYDRLKRFLQRIENQDRNQIEYEDDFWAFCQNCWHLKDWIKNDTSLPQLVRNRVENEVKKYHSLMVFADLANRSKHFTLWPKSNRVDGKLKGKDVIIHAPTFHLNLETGQSTSEGGSIEYNYRVVSIDGAEYSGLDLARQALENWRQVIQKLGI
jgi:hypothetical protein